MPELPLHHLETHLDFGERMRDYLLIGRDPKSWEDQALVRHVVDHVRVVVGIDRADPLVHARAFANVSRLKRRSLKCLVNVGRNGARLIDGKIAMLKHWY